MKPKRVTRSIKIGEIVLVENESKKRSSWPIAIVEDVIIGKDGNIRVVKLRTKFNTLMRPIKKVYPLEIQDCDDLPRPKPLTQQKILDNQRPVEYLEEDLNVSADVLKTVHTRCGRKVNVPSRYNN